MLYKKLIIRKDNLNLLIISSLPYFFLKKSNKKTRFIQSPLEKFGKKYERTLNFIEPNFTNGVYESLKEYLFFIFLYFQNFYTA